MTRKEPTRFDRKLKATFLSGIIAIGAVSSFASAAGDRGHRGHDRGYHRHSAICGCVQVTYAGRITIDGCSTMIRSDRPMYDQILCAFERAGYRAWISDGCIRVDTTRCRPRVSWARDSYNARFSWDRGRLGISLSRPDVYHGSGWNDHSSRHRPAIGRVIRRTFCD